MCGIVAAISDGSVAQMLLNGITALQNRGYDSCGGVLLSSADPLWTWKRASTDAESSIVAMELAVASIVPDRRYTAGCFQTRWATHGAKTDTNAHPHTDASRRFFVVHNGIITNYAVLREKLQALGYVFVSQTDTEVVPHLLADAVKRLSPDEDPDSMLDVWKSVIRSLEGTWSLVMCDRNTPDRLYISKNGSPLLMAVTEDKRTVQFASETSGFHLPTQAKLCVDLEDGETFVCKRADDGTCVVRGYRQHHPTGPNVIALPTTETARTPAPFSTWTEKEIADQPEALWNALNRGGRL